MTDVSLLLPDSEDRENLLKNGVTHILSIHNSAKPVLEVSSPARGGHLGDHPGGAGAGKMQMEPTPPSPGVGQRGKKQRWDLRQFFFYFWH